MSAEVPGGAWRVEHDPDGAPSVLLVTAPLGRGRMTIARIPLALPQARAVGHLIKAAPALQAALERAIAQLRAERDLIYDNHTNAHGEYSDPEDAAMVADYDRHIGELTRTLEASRP